MISIYHLVRASRGVRGSRRGSGTVLSLSPVGSKHRRSPLHVPHPSGGSATRSQPPAAGRPPMASLCTRRADRHSFLIPPGNGLWLAETCLSESHSVLSIGQCPPGGWLAMLPLAALTVALLQYRRCHGCSWGTGQEGHAGPPDPLEGGGEGAACSGLQYRRPNPRSWSERWVQRTAVEGLPLGDTADAVRRPLCS